MGGFNISKCIHGASDKSASGICQACRIEELEIDAVKWFNSAYAMKREVVASHERIEQLEATIDRVKGLADQWHKQTHEGSLADTPEDAVEDCTSDLCKALQEQECIWESCHDLYTGCGAKFYELFKFCPNCGGKVELQQEQE